MDIDLDTYQLNGRLCPHCFHGTWAILEKGEMLLKGSFRTYCLLQCLDCKFLWNEIYSLAELEEENPNAIDDKDAMENWIFDN